MGITAGIAGMLGRSDGVATGDPNFDNPGGESEKSNFYILNIMCECWYIISYSTRMRNNLV